MPQRMVLNNQLQSLISASSLVVLVRAVKNAFSLSRQTGDSPWALLKSGWRMYRAGDQSLSATMMSANAPMMIQEAVVHGRPDSGILPSGQIAGLIEDLPTVNSLVSSIVSEALATIEKLGKVGVLDASVAASTAHLPEDGSQ